MRLLRRFGPAQLVNERPQNNRTPHQPRRQKIPPVASNRTGPGQYTHSGYRRRQFACTDHMGALIRELTEGDHYTPNEKTVEFL